MGGLKITNNNESFFEMLEAISDNWTLTCIICSMWFFFFTQTWLSLSKTSQVIKDEATHYTLEGGASKDVTSLKPDYNFYAKFGPGGFISF